MIRKISIALPVFDARVFFNSVLFAEIQSLVSCPIDVFHFIEADQKYEEVSIMNKMKGFTLIELLIVVAIIGILAAIAIPNFLEAQARAKISRVMADLRTVNLAMSAYNVDYNQYPDVSDDGVGRYMGWLMSNPANPFDRWAGKALTTPTAYISSVPMDRFNTDCNRRWFGSTEEVSFWSNIYSPYLTEQDRAEDDAWFAFMRSAVGDWFPAKPSWIMESCGPSILWWNEGGPGDPHSYFYDPTNGTVSCGMISLSDQKWLSPKK